MASANDAYNLLSTEAMANPYPVYDRLRRESPVHWSEPLQVWILSRHDDVVAASLDTRLSSDRMEQFSHHQLQSTDLRIVADFLRIANSTMLTKDIPQHARLRKMASESFTRRALEAFRPVVQKVVDDLVEHIQPRGGMDLVADFAQPLPANVIAEMFGIPAADRANFQRWSDDTARFFGGTLGDIMEDAQRANDSVRNLEEYFLHLIARRRREPGTDLMSLLIANQDQGRWDAQELSAQCILILAAGHVTTIDQIGNGVHALLQHPDQLHKLRAHPELIHTAVEEVLRYDSSVPFIHRVARQEIEIRGQRILPGHIVFLGLASANHDPEHFPEPEVFDITRAPTRHLAFGHGGHLCLGAELARRELEIGLSTVFQRLPGLQYGAQPAELRHESLMFRGFKSMPLVF
jgi:cytochrome P450 PksS